MNESKHQLRRIIHYYFPLLQRYARMLTQDEEMAATIAQQVLEEQYEIDRLTKSLNLRHILKTDTCNICHLYVQSKIFDQGVTKFRGRNYSTLHTNTI